MEVLQSAAPNWTDTYDSSNCAFVVRSQTAYAAAFSRGRAGSVRKAKGARRICAWFVHGSCMVRAWNSYGAQPKPGQIPITALIAHSLSALKRIARACVCVHVLGVLLNTGRRRVDRLRATTAGAAARAMRRQVGSAG